jgi:hypothetical protein
MQAALRCARLRGSAQSRPRRGDRRDTTRPTRKRRQVQNSPSETKNETKTKKRKDKGSQKGIRRETKMFKQRPNASFRFCSVRGSSEMAGCAQLSFRDPPESSARQRSDKTVASGAPSEMKKRPRGRVEQNTPRPPPSSAVTGCTRAGEVVAFLWTLSSTYGK